MFWVGWHQFTRQKITIVIATKMDDVSDEFEDNLPCAINWLQVSKMHSTEGRHGDFTTIFDKLLDFEMQAESFECILIINSIFLMTMSSQNWQEVIKTNYFVKKLRHHSVMFPGGIPNLCRPIEIDLSISERPALLLT